ncbi:MAG TPA: hypothetical protein VGF86_14095 [Candidatus Tumulicola sp.]|jgi:hypothetical protein
MNALNTQDETFQLGMYASEVQNQEQMQMQSEVFDQMMNERSENMREIDTPRNVDMAQRKAEGLQKVRTYGKAARELAEIRATAMAGA